MFVSLKKRAVTATVLAVTFLFVLSACGGSQQEVKADSETPVVSATANATAVVEPPQKTYRLRTNWPNITVDGVLRYEKTGDVCVIAVACVPVEAAFVRAAYFAGNAPALKTTLSLTKTSEELERWREVAVANICFVNSWEAYVAGALLYFAYDDTADIVNLADLMRSFESCDRAAVLQQPQA